MKKILLLFLVTLSFSSCEKDDICADETTPRLIMEFYDISNPASPKNVINLKVTGVGQANALNTFNGVSKIELPLNANENTTKYRLELNSTNTTVPPNEDILQLDYTRKNLYVSRACGYKMVFELNSENGAILTDSLIPDGFWIQGMYIQTININSENEAHIKIYF